MPLEWLKTDDVRGRDTNTCRKQKNAYQILVGVRLYSEIHKLGTKFIWDKEELPHQWKESIFVPIHKNGDKVTSNINAITATNLIQYYIQHSSL
jgi:CO dehydrogenase/acetyl-CoA synthase alpha subunit